jgi:hypothetical protein
LNPTAHSGNGSEVGHPINQGDEVAGYPVLAANSHPAVPPGTGSSQKKTKSRKAVNLSGEHCVFLLFVFDL